MASPNRFDSLPDELLGMILVRLDDEDSGDYSLVCKRWCNYFDKHGGVGYKDTCGDPSSELQPINKRYRKLVLFYPHRSLVENAQWLTNSSTILNSLTIHGSREVCYSRPFPHLRFDAVLACTNLEYLSLHRLTLLIKTEDSWQLWRGTDFGFPHLRVCKLSLLSGAPNEQDVMNGCPALEELEVQELDLRTRDDIWVTHASSKSLKVLKMERASEGFGDVCLDLPGLRYGLFGKCHKLVVNAPKAETLWFRGGGGEIELKAGELKHLHLDNDCTWLSAKIPMHLESLHLVIPSSIDDSSVSNASRLHVRCCGSCIHLLGLLGMERLAKCKTLQLDSLGDCKKGECEQDPEGVRLVEGEVTESPLLEELIVYEPLSPETAMKFLELFLPHCSKDTLRAVRVRVIDYFHTGCLEYNELSEVCGFKVNFERWFYDDSDDEDIR